MTNLNPMQFPAAVESAEDAELYEAIREAAQFLQNASDRFDREEIALRAKLDARRDALQSNLQ